MYEAGYSIIFLILNEIFYHEHFKFFIHIEK